ncbi:MAG: glutamate-5-semialdehyde dehydrogenase [bacterium]|nr:glutamate-5-semialdehyde dehydrogenase [bacterium]
MKSNNLKNLINQTKIASTELLGLTAKQRSAVLLALAKSLLENKNSIIKANLKDMAAASFSGKAESFVERLSLDKSKIKGMADSLKQIAAQSDNLFKTIKQVKRPSGLKIKKVIFPLGLVAMIYESRPNVTIDAFALSFKSGNAVILKGGKEIANTNKILVGLIKKVLTKFAIDTDIILDLSAVNREATLELIQNQQIDCLIPRGGKGLISFIKDNAKIPLIITGASVVHTYVDASANLDMAKKIILNAKTRRVSICNALDVILLHKNIYKNLLKLITSGLEEKNVEIRADEKSFSALKKLNYAKLKKATAMDFDTEFLDYILAIKIVNNFSEAIAHIRQHSLGHSEAIVTRNKKQAEEFFKKIDAACLYLNTSTQFSDGGEFGLGGEIGISTQKLHARGPFAHEELTTYKYLAESDGAIRK